MGPFKPVRVKEQKCLVVMPSGDDIDIGVTNVMKGRSLLDLVCKKVGIIEKEYFGFKYVHHKDKKYTWLKLDKSLSRQISKQKYEVEFHVQFWPKSPYSVKHDIARYQMFLETRQKILSGSLTTTIPVQALLASFIVQAEYSDWVENADYIKQIEAGDIKFFPDQPKGFGEQVSQFHQQNIGTSPAEAELLYLENARKLALHGMEMHPALDENHVSIVLGINYEGIQVLHNGVILNKLLWEHVYKVKKKASMLNVGLKMMLEDNAFNKLKVHFKSPTQQDLKRLHHQAHAQWMQIQKPENRKIDISGDTPTKGFKRVDSKRFSKIAADQKIESPESNGPAAKPKETSFGPVTVTINQKEENENEVDPKATETESPPKKSPPELLQEDEIEEVRLEDPKMDLERDTDEKSDDLNEDAKVKPKQPVVIDFRESVYEEVRIEDKPMDSISIKTDDGDMALTPDANTKNQSDEEFEDLTQSDADVQNLSQSEDSIKDNEEKLAQSNESISSDEDKEDFEDLSEQNVGDVIKDDLENEISDNEVSPEDVDSAKNSVIDDFEELTENEIEASIQINQDFDEDEESQGSEEYVTDNDSQGGDTPPANLDSEGASENENESGNEFEEFTEHEIEASINLNPEHSSSDEDGELYIIGSAPPEINVQDEERDEVNSITQSYRQRHDWDSLLNRSMSANSEHDERLMSMRSTRSHMSHVSEVSKMSEKELLDSIDIDTVLVETTEYVTEEVDPETSNVTVVTHTTFTEIEAAESVIGVTPSEMGKDEIVLGQDASTTIETTVYS
eukprot:TCONS_00048628-protein